MTDDFFTEPRSRWGTILKGLLCLGIVAMLAAAFWFRWIPGRPVPPEWARGNRVPDNSLSFDSQDDLPSNVAGDVEIVSSSNFLFTMGEGGGLQGFDVIQISPDGSCLYSYSDPASLSPTQLPLTRPESSARPANPWRQVRFQVPRQTVTELRQLLLDTDYFNLKRAYRSPLKDGAQWFVRVRAGSHEKSVWCDNHFPRDIMAINDFVRTQIVEPHEGARGVATPVDLPPDWLPELTMPKSVPEEADTNED